MYFLINFLKKIATTWFGGSDYYRVLYTAYVLGGTWMLRKKYIEKNIYVLILFRFLQLIALSSCVISFVSFVYDAYLIRKNIEKLSYNLGVTVFFTMSLFRFFFLTYRKVEYEEVLDTINQNLYLEDVGRSPRDLSIQKEGEQRLKHISKIFYFLLFLGVVSKALAHIVTEKSLPIPFPYMAEMESPLYEIVFVLECCGFTHFVGVVITLEMITDGIFIRILEHFVILSKNMMEIEKVFSRGEFDKTGSRGVLIGGAQFDEVWREFDHKWRQVTVFEMLKKNIIHHQEIIKIMKRVNDVLQESFFIQIFGGGLLLVDLFLHVTLRKNSPVMALCQFTYSFAAVLDITFVCYYCSEVETKSHDAARTLYAIDWLAMDLKNKQTLRFFQLALWRHPVVKAGNVFTINLNMYLKFLNSIYSYVAFMQNTVKRSA